MWKQGRQTCSADCSCTLSHMRVCAPVRRLSFLQVPIRDGRLSHYMRIEEQGREVVRGRVRRCFSISDDILNTRTPCLSQQKADHVTSSWEILLTMWLFIKAGQLMKAHSQHAGAICLQDLRPNRSCPPAEGDCLLACRILCAVIIFDSTSSGLVLKSSLKNKGIVATALLLRHVFH